MSSDSQSDRRGPNPDGFAEFTEEMRLLAEVLLARVEPMLRRTAADGQPDLGGCAWCPVCAAAALVRGDHHDVIAALAEHGTSMVTVLREALAGIPVEPVLPPEWADHAAGHPDSNPAAPFAATAQDDQTASNRAHQHHTAAPTDAAGHPRWATADHAQSAPPRPRRVDGHAAPRPTRAPSTPHITPEPTEAADDRSTPTRAPRSQYVDIPVTIRG
ncbi:hypothetical protein ACFWU5_11050 [Nocardia sp. NPDC058640]|uniref:hypothetical protein n=1 Tax=Nocardia sp. NPDC058640 TaxID=3346571 RepID=UPI0036487B08